MVLDRNVTRCRYYECLATFDLLAVAMTPSIEITHSDDERITFTLFGSERDGGYVRLEDLAECITRLQECLQETERCVTGKRPSLTYVVEKMIVGSPADVTFVAKKPKRGGDPRKAVSTVFRNTIAQLGRGEKRFDNRLDYSAMKSFQRCGEVARKGTDREKRRLVISGTEVTSQYLFAADSAVQIEECSFGSVSGVLERIDVHGANQFAIYPRPEGSPQIRCFFEDDLLKKVADSVKQLVTVYGKMHFSANRVSPIYVNVEDMETHESVDNLPTLSSLAGCLSHLTEDSTEIIRKMRDGWAD